MSRSHRQSKRDLSITRGDTAGIGGRIRRVRGTASQREFADRLGISREQLSRIESGAQVPGTETLRRLARVARVSLDFVLLGGAAASPPAAAMPSGGFTAALEPLLGATTLRLSPATMAAGRRADRAWAALSERRREDIRALVRRVALVAIAVEAVLPAGAARVVIEALSAALSTLLADRLAAAPRRALIGPARR